MIFEDRSRGTGRTSRMVDKIVELMKQGIRVNVVLPNHSFRDYVSNLILHKMPEAKYSTIRFFQWTIQTLIGIHSQFEANKPQPFSITNAFACDTKRLLNFITNGTHSST